MMPIGSGRLPVNKARGQTSHRSGIAKRRSASVRICIGRATWSSGSSTKSSNVGASQLDMTDLRPTTLLSLSSHPFGSGYAFMSPRPSQRADQARCSFSASFGLHPAADQLLSAGDARSTGVVQKVQTQTSRMQDEVSCRAAATWGGPGPERRQHATCGLTA